MLLAAALAAFVTRNHDESDVVHRIWGDNPPTQTLLGVAALALPGMAFEVDAIALRQ